MTKLKYEATQETSEDELIFNLAQKVEVTDFGLLQIQKIRETIIEQKAYNRMQHDHANLYSDVAREAYLTGQLVLMDIILAGIRNEPNEPTSQPEEPSNS